MTPPAFFVRRALPLLTCAALTSCGASTPAPTTSASSPTMPAVPPPPTAREEVMLVPQHAARGEDASAWDPTTRTLVVASGSGHVILVDGETGLVRSVERFDRRAYDPSLSVGAGYGVISYDGSAGDRVGREIDLRSGLLAEPDVAFHGTSSADGTTLATWADSSTEIRIRTADQAGSVRCPIVPDPGFTAALSQDGKLLFVCSGTRAAILDASDCATRRTFEVPQPPISVAVSNEGRVALELGGSLVLYEDSEEPVRLLESADVYGGALGFTPDGRVLVLRRALGLGGSGSELVSGIDLATRTPSALDPLALRRAFELPPDAGMTVIDRVGGEHSVHRADFRPDAEGIVFGQRGSSVLVSRAGASILPCVDGEQDWAWSPIDPGVLLQGEEGRCEVASGVGTLPTDHYYDELAVASDTAGDRVVCAMGDRQVCVTFPGRGGAARLATAAGGRGRALRGAADAEVSFSPTAAHLVLTTSEGSRILDVATGREIFRGALDVLDWSVDGAWAVLGGEQATTFRRVDDARSVEVPYRLSAETSAFEAGTASALVCSPGGIERLSLTDGARTPVLPTPCETIRSFGDRAVARFSGDPRLHILDAHGGAVLLDFDGAAEPGPAGSPYFHGCEGSVETIIDIAGARQTTLEEGCTYASVAQNGQMWIPAIEGEGVRVVRRDGASIVLHVIWVGDVPHVYAEAADHAFWMPTVDELAELNVVVRTEGTTTVLSAVDAEMRRRFYRPTLFADFMDARPLPTASR